MENTNNYTWFTKNESENQECPILAESVTLQDTDHPKRIILIKTGDVMKPFDTLSLWKWVTRARKTNPLTNQDLSPFDLERIDFYKESLDLFPEMTLAQTKPLVHETLNKFFQTGECEWTKGLYYFADIEDFKPYMFSLPANPSFRHHADTVMSLLADPKYWILRKTSLVDSPGKHEYYAVSTNSEHHALRHSFGQGYWLMTGNGKKSLASKFLSPSFMGVLKMIKKSIGDLVCGSTDKGKIQLSIVHP